MAVDSLLTDDLLEPFHTDAAFNGGSSKRGKNAKRRKLVSENEDEDFPVTSDSGVGTLTPESDRPFEMITPFSCGTPSSDSENMTQVTENQRRSLPRRRARDMAHMNLPEVFSKRLRKNPILANKNIDSIKRVTPTRVAKEKDFFSYSGNDCFESGDKVDRFMEKPSTSKAHCSRKRSAHSPPQLDDLSNPISPDSSHSDDGWMPALSPNDINSIHDDNESCNVRCLTPDCSDSNSDVICLYETLGIKKKSLKEIVVDDDEPLDVKPKIPLYEGVELQDEDLDRLVSADDQVAAAAALHLENIELENVESVANGKITLTLIRILIFE